MELSKGFPNKLGSNQFHKSRLKGESIPIKTSQLFRLIKFGSLIMNYKSHTWSPNMLKVDSKDGEFGLVKL